MLYINYYVKDKKKLLQRYHSRIKAKTLAPSTIQIMTSLARQCQTNIFSQILKLTIILTFN